ncbi:MAG: cytochrome c [Longimicrobiales bacterium]
MNRPLAFLVFPVVTLLTAAGFMRGGWAVITVEDLPTALNVRGTTPFAFMVRQHGVSPLADLEPTISMWEGRDTLSFSAAAGAKKGLYSADLRAPRAGEWRVRINSGFRDMKLELLPIPTTPRVVAIADHGHRLFVAKGCITCHQGRGTPKPLITAPDLSQPRFAPDYLKAFIANPAIRPPTNPQLRMPNLELKPAEIDAIVAYLSAPVTATNTTSPRR